MSDPQLPPLPVIDGDVDLMLDVYSHSSLRNPHQPLNDTYGDATRLQELGERALDLAVTVHLLNMRPLKTLDDVKAEKLSILSDNNIENWLKSYSLKDKLRVAPSEYNNVMSSPKEMTTFFQTYVGAVYFRNNGLAVIQNWISRLISPDTPEMIPNQFPSPAMDGGYGAQMQQQPFVQQQFMQQHMQQQPIHYSPHGQNGGFNSFVPSPPSQLFASPGLFTPPPPLNNPPPLPSSPSGYSSPPPPSSTLSLVTLALVNQTASQKSIAVTYPAEQVGPSHQPTWTVRCCMNGIEKGRGVGKSQKLAKEEAARQAWAAMGWGPT